MSLELASPRSLPQSDLVSRGLRFVAHLARALGHRRDVHLLLDMDDRCLKDIGLVRGDVVGALTEPFSRDPSTILLVRSVERRARSRELDRYGAERRTHA